MRQVIRIVAHRNRNGSLSIRLRVSLPSGVCDISTGVTVPSEQWDKRRQRVLPSHGDHRTLNAQVDTTAERLREFIARNPHATALNLRSLVNTSPDTFEAISDDFLDTYGSYMSSEQRRMNWTEGTIKNHKILLTHLTRFNPLLRLSAVDVGTLDKFCAYLIDKGLNNTTTARLVRMLFSFLRWCDERKLIDGASLRSYHPRLPASQFETKQVIYLTRSELESVETVELPDYLAVSRDIFVLCAYTGLRISDAMRLRQSDIHDNAVHLVTRKTNDNLTIELNRHSGAVVERYKSDDITAYLLPRYTLDTYNAHLRIICQQCHIDTPVHLVHYVGAERIERIVPKWRLVTSHCARRTFVVNALSLGIPAEVITRWTGHSSLEAMRPYMAIVDELKASSMAKFDDI